MFWIWVAVFLGVHAAIRKHLDTSDGTKLRREKSRFRNWRSRVLLNEVHRAKNMRTLEEQLDGLLWEAEVRAAEEAIAASHCDHNADTTVHRFVRRVQDSVVSGGGGLEPEHFNRAGVPMRHAPITAEWGKWGCRNKHPGSRFVCDVGIIEGALGVRKRRTFIAGLMRRQRTGPVTERETTLFLIAVLIMACVKPNCYWMEMSFCIVFAVEFLLSFRYLQVEFVFGHYFRLLNRLICLVVAIVPSAIQFVILRMFRFCEGWPRIFQVPGVACYSLMSPALYLFTMWMICFVVIWLFYFETGAEGICHSALSCVYVSFREMLLPPWNPTHVNILTEFPIACLIIVVFQLVFVPFAVTIALHPLLRMSSFIGRFIRLLVQSLHHDVVEYINSYLECPSWFAHRRLHSDLPARTITKLRMWFYDVRRRSNYSRRGDAPPHFGPPMYLRKRVTSNLTDRGRKQARFSPALMKVLFPSHSLHRLKRMRPIITPR
ncbi:uncharacterized protein Tco025E_04077 [Trypanosoma conorhini]|uniref:Uncharacterized protein n=1 Tax=Trypanosoma conorhini TaxID=83891 RepID=A0A3R7LS08_9TRYP|nr:uncharacterized protein Tco025E_04077 [Trypanosoma conorhini]RNF19569.1 hypothetical protein Tco025E_04077 [Trypanosoma conorhini]